MKAVRWYGPRDMRLEDAEMPAPGPHDVLLRVESVGVCGSDMHYYLDGHIGSTRITSPLILGHEYGGIVEAVGEKVDQGLIGKRVAVEPGIPCMQCEWCRTGCYNVCEDMFFPGGPPYDGCLSEFYTVNAAFCFPVPDGMGAQEAAMMEPLAVALHTIELAHMKPGDTAAVLGLGPIGLLVAEVARFAGAGTIYGCDLHDYRVEAGLRYGCDTTFNASNEDSVERIKAETKGRGVDVVFDCSNRGETLAVACEIARPAGRCVLTGISGNDSDSLPVGRARRKELTLQWCRRFKHNFPAAIALAASGRLDVTSMVTHSFSLEQTPEAFDLVASYGDGVLKASIDQ